MSNDTRAMIASDSQGDLLPAEGGELAALQPGANRAGITTLVHRSLRGRYWLVIPLALICGAAGALCGWKFFHPKYRSVGMIQLQSKVPTVNPNDQPDYLKTLEMYDEFVNTQLPIILSQRVIGDAMHDSLWQATKRGSDEEAMKKFIDNLTVEHPAHTQSIDIALLDPDPAVAAAGVQAVVKVYTDYYIARDKKILEALLQSLEDKVDKKKRAIDSAENDRQELTQVYGTANVDGIVKTEQDQLENLKVTRNKLIAYLDRMKSSDSPAQPIDELTDVQIGMVYPPMQAKLDELADAQKKLAQAQAAYLDNHPAVTKARAELQASADAVSEFARQYRSLLKRIASQGLSGIDQGEQHEDTSPMAMSIKLAMRPDSLNKEIQLLTTQIDERKAAMASATDTQQKIARKNDEIKSLTDERRDAELELSTYRNEYNRGLMRMVVLNAGEVPIQPYKDPRKFAIAGLGLGGLLLPVLLFMWIGFMDRRLRFSEQAGRDDAGLPPLLGILPTLPDQLNDPEQAAVAAHCVHQIRIMLQVSASGGPRELPARKAYVVTSASPRDGKTSLTMALGLSYAASGSRTLVVDCDMVGQGLTNRLKANATEGLLEALHAGTLAGRVKKTTTPNLYILPIGNAERSHASAISPPGIRKLLLEARRIFDVIIVDTGPILGSLEAQVVSAAADSVILTIARGQQQPLVQKALRMLRQINAQVAGMVFNRAQQKDFENSVTSSSFKSLGSTPPTRKTLLSEGAEESRFGPLARSVASFLPTPPPPTKPVVTKPAPKPVAPADQIHVEVVSRMVESPACEDTVFGEAAPEQGNEE